MLTCFTLFISFLGLESGLFLKPVNGKVVLLQSALLVHQFFISVLVESFKLANLFFQLVFDGLELFNILFVMSILNSKFPDLLIKTI
jgi:hypothetical protein